MINISHVPQTRAAVRALVSPTDFLKSPPERKAHRIPRSYSLNLYKKWPGQPWG